MRKVLRNSPARLRISYADGSWSDELRGSRFLLAVEGRRAVLIIELARESASNGADASSRLREFRRKRHLLHTIQVAKPEIRRPLQEVLLKMENPDFCVTLIDGAQDAMYPASIVFGPDVVTLNLG